MRPPPTSCRALVAAMTLTLTACSDSTLEPVADPLVVHVVAATVSTQATRDAGWVQLATTLEMHNRSTETIGFHGCGAITLTDAELERTLEVICAAIRSPLTTIPPGETLTIERRHVGCLGLRCAPAWDFVGITGTYRVRVQYEIVRPALIEGALGTAVGAAYSEAFVVTLDPGLRGVSALP